MSVLFGQTMPAIQTELRLRYDVRDVPQSSDITVCIHEGIHGVAKWAHAGRVRELSAEQDGENLGTYYPEVEWSPQAPDEVIAWVNREAEVTLAPDIGESWLASGIRGVAYAWIDPAADLEDAGRRGDHAMLRDLYALYRAAGGPLAERAWVAERRHATRALIEPHKAVVERVALALLLKPRGQRRLTEWELEDLVPDLSQRWKAVEPPAPAERARLQPGRTTPAGREPRPKTPIGLEIGNPHPSAGGPVYHGRR